MFKDVNLTDYIGVDPIASYVISNNASINIIAIQYGINDYVIFKPSWDNKLHYSKIYYTAADNDYFRYGDKRIKLNECMKF